MKNLAYIIQLISILFKTGFIYILGLFVLIICLLASCGDQTEIYTVDEKIFNESVYASGVYQDSDYIIKSGWAWKKHFERLD